ncbi:MULTISPECIES: Asp23/Gls24 family envelope stress response protein [unclassified Streptomyces]|uniref:Asp23/Gls24 family envelope stress response protein n=1 Tax=Streptomyces sp. TN58 TaxID=234612 RepID=UPI001F17B70C|nr:Asp23/Gls24 family envelope stress response protein [Streptomyces sp. TN58]
MTSHSAAGPAGSTSPVLPAAERGATVIPDKVVARIAARAAQEALAALTDTPVASAARPAPRASVSAGGGAARLRLTLDFPYPLDLASASRHVQHHVSERVARLTGMHITEVTLVIEHLAGADGLEPRRVR